MNVLHKTADFKAGADGKVAYSFDIILQGESETVFFDI